MKIFYHYTNHCGAMAIRKSGYLHPSTESGAFGPGVYLTDLDPYEFFRNEILVNNYGGIHEQFHNRADWVVEVMEKNIDIGLLERVHVPGERDRRIYLYPYFILVDADQVYDKPRCSKNFDAVDQIDTSSDEEEEEEEYESDHVYEDEDIVNSTIEDDCGLEPFEIGDAVDQIDTGDDEEEEYENDHVYDDEDIVNVAIEDDCGLEPFVIGEEELDEVENGQYDTNEYDVDECVIENTDVSGDYSDIGSDCDDGDIDDYGDDYSDSSFDY